MCKKDSVAIMVDIVNTSFADSLNIQLQACISGLASRLVLPCLSAVSMHGRFCQHQVPIATPVCRIHFPWIFIDLDKS